VADLPCRRGHRSAARHRSRGPRSTRPVPEPVHGPLPVRERAPSYPKVPWRPPAHTRHARYVRLWTASAQCTRTRRVLHAVQVQVGLGVHGASPSAAPLRRIVMGARWVGTSVTTAARRALTIRRDVGGGDEGGGRSHRPSAHRPICDQSRRDDGDGVERGHAPAPDTAHGCVMAAVMAFLLPIASRSSAARLGRSATLA